MRVFSGMQPTGEPHLGNYLGAIRGWAANQGGERENFFCIVDLHSLTVPYDPEGLRDRTRKLAATYFAAGIDPSLSPVFVQSHVSAHSEACWLLNCVTPLGWLQKMTQYKDKSAKQESIGTGLLDYPVLMACDILLYNADEVPVGEDQKQHVELARNIAGRFNHIYGDTFTMPKPVIAKVAARVMGLDDPTKKMSKSDSTVRGHAVSLFDDPKEIERTFKRAKTDSYNEIVFSDDEDRAGVRNLLEIYQAATGRSREETLADFADARGYGDLKMRVAEVVIQLLRPIREETGRYLDDLAELDRLLAVGAERARSVATPTLRQMQHKMGLILSQ